MQLRIALSILLLALQNGETLEPGIQSDVRHVAEETGVPTWVLEELVRRESNGYREAVRYCRHWEGRRCLDQASCYVNCRERPEVWNNKLDLGLWQLRHSPTWSWFRWYSKHFDEVAPDCALDPECSRQVVVEVIRYLQRRARREARCDARRQVPELQWLGYWNGCDVYRSYARKWHRRQRLLKELAWSIFPTLRAHLDAAAAGVRRALPWETLTGILTAVSSERESPCTTSYAPHPSFWGFSF